MPRKISINLKPTDSEDLEIQSESGSGGGSGGSVGGSGGDSLRQVFMNKLSDLVRKYFEADSDLLTRFIQEYDALLAQKTLSRPDTHRLVMINELELLRRHPEELQQLCRDYQTDSSTLPLFLNQSYSSRDSAYRVIAEEFERRNASQAKGTVMVSTLFVCPKCRGKDSTYYMTQDRSSDEPMTVHHQCLKCGHRWKTE